MIRELIVEVGDKVNTSLGRHTLVVGVEKDYVVLQADKQYVIAHGPYFDDLNEIVSWGYGDYLNSFEELAMKIVSINSKENYRELESLLSEIASINHESYTKAIMAIELNMSNDKFLEQMYQQYMDSEVQLLDERIYEEFTVELLKNIKDYCAALDEYAESFDHYEYKDQEIMPRQDVIDHMAEAIFNGNSEKVLIALDTTIKTYCDDEEIVANLQTFKDDLENSDFHKYTLMKQKAMAR